MISPYAYIAYSLWCVLVFVFAAGYFRNKRTLRRPAKGRFLGTTTLIIASFFLLFGTSWLGVPATPQRPLLGILGDVLCIAGVLFAVWARIALGGNWSGATATIKKNHELIQIGPYALVRHPIYTGFSLAMIGTALAVGLWISYIGALLGLTAFLMRIPIEEQLMMELFPSAFSAYKLKVKRIIPFVW
jgi:protein-S-isoprenylcysteine O-methyltransferase Ste14